MSEAPWRQRFTGPTLTLPGWARDNPERCLYSTNVSGKWEIYAWDRASDKHRQVTDRPTGTQGGALDPLGRSIHWFDDGRGSEMGVWMVEPFEGGPATQLAPELAPAYTAGLLLAKSFSVVGRSIPGAGTEMHLLRPGQQPKLIYKHRSAANLAGLSRDDSLLCIMHTEQSDSLHRALRVIDLEGNTVAGLFDGRDRDLLPAGFARVPGDARLLVVHQRRGRQELLIWDPRSGAQEELPIDLPGELAGGWCPDARAVLVVHSRRGRSELYKFDLESGALERVQTEPGSIGGAQVRPDGEVWYSWNSSSTPAEIRAGDRILLAPPGLPRPSGAAYADHDVAGVPAFVARPAGPGPHPAVFWVHGGPTGHDTDSYNPTVQAWVDHGYAVVMVNYRGSTGYGLAWRDALVGNPGLTELEDLAAVRDWAINEGIADPARMVLAGGSWGGYLTLLGLGTQPDLWSLGIAGVPIADWLEQYDDVMEPLKAYDRSLFGASPDEEPERYRRASPSTYIDNVRVPVLVMAGLNDPRCPIRQIESYLARLDALEKPHETYKYDAGHGSMVIDETLKQMEMRLDFAARHLGTMPPL